MDDPPQLLKYLNFKFDIRNKDKELNTSRRSRSVPSTRSRGSRLRSRSNNDFQAAQRHSSVPAPATLQSSKSKKKMDKPTLESDSGYYVSPLIPGRGIRTYAQGGKLGWVGVDPDATRPAAGMTSAQLNQRDRFGKMSRSAPECDCEPVRHIPGYTGSILSDGDGHSNPEHICRKKEIAAGVSTMELCPDEHEYSRPPSQQSKVRETAGDLLHPHGHPDHVIEDDRSSMASDVWDTGNGFGNLSAYLPKGKTVIRGGKLVHLSRDAEDRSPPAGIASTVHARSAHLNLLSGPVDACDNGMNRGDSKVSGHGGRFCLRGGKLIKVAGQEDNNLGAAGVRTGELNKLPR